MLIRQRPETFYFYRNEIFLYFGKIQHGRWNNKTHSKFPAYISFSINTQLKFLPE